MNFAPVLIPTLCRYKHFRQCIESLSACTGADKTEVYVGLDFPTKESHKRGYEQIKLYLEKQGDMGFKKLHVLERPYNYGVMSTPSHPSNLRDLVRKARKRYKSYIITEDDNVFSPNFLIYMNACLAKYEDDPRVFMVCGYSYPVPWIASEGATIIKQQCNASLWGAGMWTKKEEEFGHEALGGKMLSMLPKFIHEKRCGKMTDACLSEYVTAACRSWFYKDKMFQGATDICRRAWLAVADKYAITPVISKSRNLGFDGSGAFCQDIDSDLNGETARTYNYSNQSIDSSYDFALVEDTKDCTEENRRRLNSFDRRTPKETAEARHLLWLCNHTGIWSARLYALLAFPFDFAPRAFRKLGRALKR